MSIYTGTKCQICQTEMEIFYQQSEVPVNSVILLKSKDQALNYPKGDILLGFCHNCGFIQNTRFNEQLVQYSEDYNPTQAHSSTFNQFQEQLVKKLIDKYQLRQKKIIEIGCGQGEFIELLARYGKNTGIGFDPACQRRSQKDLIWIADFYSKQYFQHKADLVCCKMTLEHIAKVKSFVEMTLSALANPNSKIFYQIPETTRILKEVAFWDIYYEHCSYFSRASITRLFKEVGLEVQDLWYGFDNQYLMIDAELKEQGINHNYSHIDFKIKNDMEEVKTVFNDFKENFPKRVQAWKQFLAESGKTVLWGGGSKGVAFLSSIKNEIEYVVDIDPRKENTFIAGGGQRIISPEQLKDIEVDSIIVMNPVYRGEIIQELNELGVKARVVAITEVV